MIAREDSCTVVVEGDLDGTTWVPVPCGRDAVAETVEDMGYRGRCADHLPGGSEHYWEWDDDEFVFAPREVMPAAA